MKVLKFGGSSISNAKNIEKVLDILKDYDSNIIVIFSAFGKTTDKLIECGRLASKRDSNYKTLFQSLLDEIMFNLDDEINKQKFIFSA